MNIRVLTLFLLLYAGLVTTACAGEPPPTPFIRIAAEMHSGKLQYIASDADGRLLATAALDKTVKLWDAASGKLLRTLRPPVGPGTEGVLNAVALSPDGKTVAAAGFTGSSWDKTFCVYLFDAESGEMTSRITGLPMHILRLEYSRDGKQLAAAVAASNGIHVFSTDDNRKLYSDSDFKGNIFAVEYAGNGNLLTASDQGEFRLYRPDGSRVFGRTSDLGKRIYNVSMAPDSSRFAVAYEWESRKEVDILNAEDGRWEQSLKGVQGGFQSVAWSPDGRYIYAAGGKQNQSGYKTLIKWSVESRSIDETIVLPTMDTVRKLLPLKNGSLAFLSTFAGFGVVGGKDGPAGSPAAGGVLFYNRLAVPDFQKNHDSFMISPDAGSVLFSYERHGQARALFDLNNRRLTTSGVSDAGLLKPRLTGSGIDLKNWDNITPDIPRLNGKKLAGFGYGGWEFSSCLAVRHDDAGFVIGSTHFLRSYDKKGKQLWKRRITERAWDVNISADDRTLVAAFDDGTIRWFAMTDGHELYALYLHPDRKRWVLWLPDGYFDHGPDSEGLVGFVVNRQADQAAEIVSINRMYDLFYRPDIVEKAVSGQDISAHLKQLAVIGSGSSPKQPALVPNAERAAPEHPEQEEQAPATRKMALDSLVNHDTLPPRVRFITPAGVASSATIKVSAELCDSGGGIGEVTLYLNEMPIVIESGDRGRRTPANASAAGCVTFARTISLVQDRNVISLMARNRSNIIESRRESIELYRPVTSRQQAARLHILTVAVNSYRDRDLRLKYPINDAEELAHIVAEKGKSLFSQVQVYTLHDEQVTRPKLEARFAEISSLIGRDDVFVLFLAGHGVSEERDGMYYFLPADFRYTDADSVASQGISMNDFKRWLSGIQAMKSLILLDTCSSGAFAEAIVSRGLTEKTAITKLARAVGRATIAASSRNQAALEGYEGHGVFSYILIEGIRGKAANTDGQITINRLAAFIEETLPSLTYKKWGYEQIPQRSLIGNDFPIGMR
jgi:WD40 repeat protein